MNDLENIKSEIKIPKGLDCAVEKGIKRGKKDRKIKRFTKTYKMLVAIASVIAVTVIVGIINPNVVKAMPGMQSIFKLINHGNRGGNFEKFEQYSTSVNKTEENNGIKITIDKIVIDNNTVAITSILEGDNIKEGKGVMSDIKINGKSLGWDSKDEKVDGNKLIMITYGNVSDMGLSDNVDVDINIIWVDDVKGPWNFKFNVSKTENRGNSKVINLDKSIKLPDSTLKLDNLVISPLGNTINYSGIYDNTNESKKIGIFNYIVMDDKGRKLVTNDLGSSSSNEKYEGKIEILDDLSNVKSLTVVPILDNWDIKTREINNFSYPILQTTINSTDFNQPQEIITKSRPVTEKEKSNGYALDNYINVYNIDESREFSSIDNLVNQRIKASDNNTVLIKSIEVSEKETKITFKIEGNGSYTYRNIDSVVILDEDYNDIEKAEDGDCAVMENINERIVSIKLPTIDKTKRYKIALPITEEPSIEEKYKMNIDLTE